MVKTVFIDYMGTTVEERSQEMVEIVQRICKNSSVHALFPPSLKSIRKVNGRFLAVARWSSLLPTIMINSTLLVRMDMRLRVYPQVPSLKIQENRPPSIML